MKKISVGVIGFGLSGRFFHLPFLKQHGGYVVEMICTSQIDSVKKEFPNAKVVSDAKEIFENNQIDLVINTAPNDFHYSYSKLALCNNKHVVIEKPFVNNVNEGNALIQIASEKRQCLTVYHNRRYDGDFLTIKKLINENILGDIKYFESHFDRWSPQINQNNWREKDGVGSGILYDLGSHLIDQMIDLFGIPQRLIADLGQQRPGAKTEDYFHLQFQYEKLKVVLHSSCFTNTTPRFQLFGEKGTFVKFGFDVQESQLKKGISPVSREFGIESSEYFGKLTLPAINQSEFITTEKGSYMQYYQDLYNSLVDNNISPPVKAEDALNVIKIIELCYESSKIGKAINVL